MTHRLNKAGIDKTMKRCQVGLNIRDPEGTVNNLLAECYGKIGALHALAEDLALIMPGEPGCGDISREERTRQDARRLLGYKWRTDYD